MGTQNLIFALMYSDELARCVFYGEYICRGLTDTDPGPF